MTHPLTDEICFDIAPKNSFYSDDMRTAADWQLEQVIEWMREEGYSAGLRVRLMEAMRPQENN